jgi:hypothetical protein
MGVSKKQINYETVEKLAGLHCTDWEIAYIVGVSPSTFSRRKKSDKRLCEALEKGHATGNMTLRRLQMKSARRGAAAILIWLGKQYLGQTDKPGGAEAGNGKLGEFVDLLEKVAEKCSSPQNSSVSGSNQMDGGT